jgi:hypothetical protein
MVCVGVCVGVCVVWLVGLVVEVGGGRWEEEVEVEVEVGEKVVAVEVGVGVGVCVWGVGVQACASCCIVVEGVYGTCMLLPSRKNSLRFNMSELIEDCLSSL